MIRLETFLAYAESHRATVGAIAAVMVGVIAWSDWLLPTMSIGFLYLVPILISAAALNGTQIIVLSAICSVLREEFDPLGWSLGASSRLLVAGVGFAMTGFFVTEINQRRRLLKNHLLQLEQQVQLRRDAESQLRTLIDTSPLAILTMDAAGRAVLANESARAVLGFDDSSLPGTEIAAYLPILPRMLQNYRGTHIRTNVESKGKRKNGEAFMASVWVSTYVTSSGPGLAAVIWDASENLRDREDAGFDSMMSTSRVVIGAISHEIRNLAAAAASSYTALAAVNGAAQSEPYRALGSLIHALERIGATGLNMAAQREPGVADLGTVLDEARIVIEPDLHDAGVEVTWKVTPNLPLVQADQNSLLQVFVNLARNCNCVLKTSETRELRISAAMENDLVMVRFSDTGPGVARPGELFKPFQQGAQSSGLGLYISRAILRSHGGNLRYEPQETGSCFVVELWPVDKPVEQR